MREKMGIRGMNLTMTVIMDGILQKNSSWDAFSEFCSKVMREKQAEEKRREKAVQDIPIARGTLEDLESGDFHRMRDL